MADTHTEPSPQPLSRRERGFYRSDIALIRTQHALIALN